MSNNVCSVQNQGSKLKRVFLFSKIPTSEKLFSKRDDKIGFDFIAKIPKKLKCLNFKCEQSDRYFSSDSIGFTNLHMSVEKSFAGDR